MRAADARLRVILEEPALTYDGRGGHTEAWKPYALVWGELAPTEKHFVFRLNIRRRTISTTHRVRIGDAWFRVADMVDDDPKSEWMTLVLHDLSWKAAA